MSIYSVKQSKIIAFTLIIIVGLFFVYSLHVLFTAMLAAVVLYELFKPMYIYFAEKKNINKTVSASIVIIISFIMIIIPFSSFMGLMIDKILYFIEHPEPVNKIISAVESFIGKNFDQETMKNFLEKASAWFLGLFPSFFSTAAGIILTLGMMYFFLYFMFTKSKIFEETLIKYMPFREKNGKR